ncbi:hypothetical protein ACET3Z_014312 [Daucus carota]
MGSCVSSHKHSVQSDNNVKFHNSFRAKSDNKLVVFSPIKDNSKPNGPKAQPDSAHNFADFGSKEETFFDSQAWLDSDCDDDFMSVNGEFTPSRGNTPLHHSFATGSQRVHRAVVEEPVLDVPVVIPGQPSPTDKKMRLSDLFKQSIRVKQNDDDEQNAPVSLSDKNSTTSLQSNEQIPNANVKAHQGKSLKSFQCCLPNLTASNNLSENKKMRALSTPMVK